MPSTRFPYSVFKDVTPNGSLSLILGILLKYFEKEKWENLDFASADRKKILTATILPEIEAKLIEVRDFKKSLVLQFL